MNALPSEDKFILKKPIDGEYYSVNDIINDFKQYLIA